MSSLSGAQALRVEGGEQRRHQAVDGEGPAGRGGGRRRGGAVEVELALGGGVAVGDPGAGVAHDQLLEQVAALGGVEEVGGQRGVEGQAAHVDVEAGERPHQRLGLVGGERAAARARPASPSASRTAASASSAPGIHTTSPVAPSRTERQALEVGPALGAGPRRGQRERRAVAGERRRAPWPRPAASSSDLDLGLEHLGLGRRRARGRCRAPRPAGRRAC